MSGAEEVGLRQHLLDDVKTRGVCVSILDMCVHDQVEGASQQIATVATMSGLLGGFASSILMGVDPEEEFILGCLIATIICSMSASIVASSMLLVLWMDFTRHPRCSGTQVTTRCAPIYLYVVGMFILGAFSFLCFLLSFTFVTFSRAVGISTIILVSVSLVVCVVMVIIGACVNPGQDPTPPPPVEA